MTGRPSRRAVVAMAAALWPAARAARAGQVVGRVQDLRGVLRGRFGAGLTRLAVGDGLRDGDFVQTAEDSRAVIGFLSGGALTMGPRSELVLSAEIRHAAEPPSLAVRLLRGVSRFVRDETARNDFLVDAGLATTSSRSTRWIVDRAAGRVSVFVEEGEVAVTPTGAAARFLGPGQGIDIRPSEIGPVVNWGAARIAALQARLE